MPTAGDYAAGICLPLLGGILNASWNIPSKPGAPKMLRAVAGIDEEGGWKWEHFWLVSQALVVIVNIVIISPLVGLDEIFAAYNRADAVSCAMVPLFSFVWAVGVSGFGIAIQKCGLGLGTALCMSFVVLMGVVWPVAVDGGFPSTGAGVLIGVGVVIGVIGIGLIGRAAHQRDVGRQKASAAASSLSAAEAAESPGKGEMGDMAAKVKQAEGGRQQRDSEHWNGVAQALHPWQPLTPAAAAAYGPSTPTPYPAALGLGNNGAALSVPATPSTHPGPIHVNGRALGAEEEEEERREEGAEARAPSALETVGICAVAGTLSSTLQLAFVLGADIVDDLKARGVSKLVAANSVWLMAMTVSGSCQVVYAATLVSRGKSWHRFRGTGPAGQERFEWRPWALSLGAAVFFVVHIHIYGIAAALLGDELGPVISWPVLMCATLLFGQAWGLFLAEFRKGDDGRSTNALATVVLCCSIIVTSCAMLAAPSDSE